LGYDASEKFLVSAEIEKEETAVNVNAGMQYKFLPQLLARIGHVFSNFNCLAGNWINSQIIPA
jgi:hypothetical protein